jgi:hypothetical protein
VPPLIWFVTAFALGADNSPVPEVDYFMETHPDLVAAPWALLLLAVGVIGMLDLIKSRPERSRFPWHDTFSGTYVIQVQTRFWPAVRMLVLESMDWVQRSRPWVSVERAYVRNQAKCKKTFAAWEQERAIEAEKRAIAEREEQERARWTEIYIWLDMRSDSEQDKILNYLTERRKSRQ